MTEERAERNTGVGDPRQATA